MLNQCGLPQVLKLLNKETAVFCFIILIVNMQVPSMLMCVWVGELYSLLLCVVLPILSMTALVETCSEEPFKLCVLCGLLYVVVWLLLYVLFYCVRIIVLFTFYWIVLLLLYSVASSSLSVRTSVGLLPPGANLIALNNNNNNNNKVTHNILL
jgi:hypothetical protein